MSSAASLLATYDFAIVGLNLAVAVLCLAWPRGELFPMSERWTGLSMAGAALTSAAAGLVTLGLAPSITLRFFLFAAMASFALGTCGNISNDDPRAPRIRAAMVGIGIPLAALVAWTTVPDIVRDASPWAPGVGVVVARSIPFVVVCLSLMLAECIAIARYWPRDQAVVALSAGGVVLLLAVLDFAAVTGRGVPLIGSVTAAGIVAAYMLSRIVAQYRVALAGLEGRVPGYALKRFLGAGGMAEVFMAEAVGIVGPSRRAAVKRVRRDLVDDPQLCAMFVDEARLAARLHHPNIVEVFAVGTGSGRPYIAMELIEGLPLSAVLRRRAAANQPIPFETIACIGISLCEALGYAHTLAGQDGAPLHIVHRDVSPQNVMLSRDGGVKLIDFGVARARTRELKTQVGLVRGKLAYAAPEQLRGEELDGRTDLFALGVVLYEMVTLERPFAGASEPAICSAILEGRRRSVLDVRADAGKIAAIIDRALAMSRNERYADANALAGALEEAFPGARSKLETVQELLDSVGGAAPETARSTSVESTSTETEAEAVEPDWEGAAETKLDHTRRARPGR